MADDQLGFVRVSVVIDGLGGNHEGVDEQMVNPLLKPK